MTKQELTACQQPAVSHAYYLSEWEAQWNTVEKDPDDPGEEAKSVELEDDWPIIPDDSHQLLSVDVSDKTYAKLRLDPLRIDASPSSFGPDVNETLGMVLSKRADLYLDTDFWDNSQVSLPPGKTWEGAGVAGGDSKIGDLYRYHHDPAVGQDQTVYIIGETNIWTTHDVSSIFHGELLFRPSRTCKAGQDDNTY